MSMGRHQSASMKTDVWLTPPEIVNALGPFDLDPCAAINQPWRTARAQYTREDDGLRCEWHGCVWLNPPYSREVRRWIARLADHGSGIALIFARTETQWFWDSVWTKADAVYFLKGRIHFHHADGSRAEANAGAPSVLVAYGRHCRNRLSRSVPRPGRFIDLSVPPDDLIELRHIAHDIRKNAPMGYSRCADKIDAALDRLAANE